MPHLRRSLQMVALEAAHNAPIDAIVVAAINRAGNVSAAARDLGVNVKTFHAWCDRLRVHVAVRARKEGRRRRGSPLIAKEDMT